MLARTRLGEASPLFPNRHFRAAHIASKRRLATLESSGSVMRVDREYRAAGALIPIVVLAAMIGFTLGACSRGVAEKGTASGRGSDVVPAASVAGAESPAAVLTEGDLPHFKAGLWETTLTRDSTTDPLTHNICEGETAIMVAQLAKKCSSVIFKSTFTGTIIVDSVCASGPNSIVAHGVFAGDFSSSFKTDTAITSVRGGQAAEVINLHRTFHYLGPCVPGQKPGDIAD